MGRRQQRRALMIALIPIVILLAACSPPGSKPAAGTTTQPTATQSVTTMTPAAVPQEFVSKRYGFRVTLPKDWSGQDASEAWNGKLLEGLGSPAFANFTEPATDRNLMFAAAPVANGMRLDEWQAAMLRGTPESCTEPSVAEATTLGGEPALTWRETCSDGYEPIKIVALHGNLGYVFLLAPRTSNDNAVDQSIFESIRQSFRFNG